MSHTVKVNLIANQSAWFNGKEINVHDIRCIQVDGDMNIVDVIIDRESEIHKEDVIDKNRNSDNDPSIKCALCGKGKEAGYICYIQYHDDYCHSDCSWEAEDFDGWASHEF